MSDDLFNIIYNKSLDLLSRREHSFKEIKEKLSARFENKEIIESVIEKLSDNNLVIIQDLLKLMYLLEKEKDLGLKRLLLNCHQKVLMNRLQIV